MKSTPTQGEDVVAIDERVYEIREVKAVGVGAGSFNGRNLGYGPTALRKAFQVLEDAWMGPERMVDCEVHVWVNMSKGGGTLRRGVFSVTKGQLYFSFQDNFG